MAAASHTVHLARRYCELGATTGAQHAVVCLVGYPDRTGEMTFAKGFCELKPSAT